MTNPYKLFQTDKDLEAGQGVRLEYPGFSIAIHRAGGANRQFSIAATRALRAQRRTAQGKTDPAADERVLAEIYAEAVIVGWDGVTDENGAPLAFTRENVVKLMTDLPDLFADIREQASDQENFRTAQLEAEAKN